MMKPPSRLSHRGVAQNAQPDPLRGPGDAKSTYEEGTHYHYAMPATHYDVV